VAPEEVHHEEEARVNRDIRGQEGARPVARAKDRVEETNGRAQGRGMEQRLG